MLAQKNFIRTICIDEALMIGQDGRNFCPEFRAAVRNIKALYDMQLIKCSVIAMSATFRKGDQDLVSSLLGHEPHKVIWLPLDQRTIEISVVASGKSLSSLESALTEDYNRMPNMKSIVYTNSKCKVEESIVPKCESILKKQKNPGKVMSLTGGDGIQMKILAMHLFAWTENDHLEAAAQGRFQLPNVLIMPATSAANCGVSSKECHRCCWIGFPPSMYDLVQECGRVDWNPSQLGQGDNQYELHVTLPCIVTLYVRVMQNHDHNEHTMLLVAVFGVLKLFMVPNACQHTLMEQYFENDACPLPKEDCDTMCSYCKGDIRYLTGLINITKLRSLLILFMSRKTPMLADLVNFIKVNKDNIYIELPNKLMGPIHALCLQLVANVILDLSVDVCHRSLIGKNTLKDKHVVLCLGVKEGDKPALLNNRYWEGMHF